MRKRVQLYDHQKSAIKIAKNLKKCALFLDMGMGKTVTSLTISSFFYDDLLIDKTLIIAPKRVAESVWHKEAEQWEHLKDLNIKVCVGSEKERTLALDSDADIHIINKDVIPWLVKTCKWKWDMVIVDESSTFKNQASKRFKSLRKKLNNIKSIILLTGTPSPNGYMDLWSQMFLIDRGERLGRTITSFRRRFFDSDYMGYKYTLKNGAKEEIDNLIKDVCITMSSEDYLNLPEVMLSSEYVDLPNHASKQYKELEKTFYLELEKTKITSPSTAVLSNKLLQMCNGAIYDEDKNVHEIHDEKIRTLKEIMEDNPNENFLISYNFKSDLKRIKQAFPCSIELKSAEDEDKWNKGKIKMLLAHPASAGHGLNLQYGGSVLIWFGLTWNLEYYQQFNKRLHRPGQNKPVRIVHIIAKGCLDEGVMSAIKNKAKTQKELLDYLKHKNNIS